jgi:hypothetical protein
MCGAAIARPFDLTLGASRRNLAVTDTARGRRAGRE